MSPFLRMHRHLQQTISYLALGLSLFLPLASCRDGSTANQALAPKSYTDLQGYFRALDYDLAVLDNGVPRLSVARLPTDFSLIQQIDERKRLFVLTLLPLILQVNEEILAERARVEQLFREFDQRQTIKEEDKTWLVAVARRYGIDEVAPDEHEFRARLLRRLDSLPVSLALAQAANESGWGTSRFALEGNNLFGEWTLRQGAGLVPKERRRGARHEVRLFKDLEGSLRAYMLNLNTHRAYAGLRRTRAALRAAGRQPDGPTLAQGIKAYSERGSAYVRDIERMIKENRFTLFSDAKLR